ncbi:MAG TPA: hypothetical protein VNV25_25560 [Gemmatimonadaceae bacterium]|jgi:hypothetical protein|nr:hypothetical protein [Gemmatimonadaceae bacterium]
MSPEAASTAKTAIYVVGGLVVFTTIVGVAIFAVGAKAVSNAANNNNNGKTLATGSTSAPFVVPQNDFIVISYVNGPYPLPTVAQAQAALDAVSPGMWQVQNVQEGAAGTWQHQGAFDVSAIYLGGPSTYVTNDALLSGWTTVVAQPNSGLSWTPNTPAFALTAVQDFGPSGTGSGAAQGYAAAIGVGR